MNEDLDLSVEVNAENTGTSLLPGLHLQIGSKQNSCKPSKDLLIDKYQKGFLIFMISSETAGNVNDYLQLQEKSHDGGHFL